MDRIRRAVEGPSPVPQARGAMAKLSFIPWNPDWETGVPKIDREHRAMLAMLEGLVKALAEGRETREIRSAVSMLTHYIQDHFLAEEALMAASGYPDLGRHRGAHDGLRDRLARIVLHGRSEPRALPTELVGFLIGWFQEHFSGEDRRMADHLRTLAPPPSP